MQTSSKHSENLTKLKSIGKLAKRMFPAVKWTLSFPSRDILDNYGDGYLMRGTIGTYEVEYFILFDDPRVKNWIKMIYVQLEDKKNGQ